MTKENRERAKGRGNDQVIDDGRGRSLRMDRGTRYLSDHFQNQLKYRGISPSFDFIEPPQTKGVAEPFIRTLKEQVIYGRVFQNLEEVRTAVRRFVDTYNREWRVEKIGSLSPQPGQGAVAGSGLTRQGGLKKTCAQKTGCGT